MKKVCKTCANRIKKVCVKHEVWLIDREENKFPYFIKNVDRLTCGEWEMNPAGMYLDREPEDWEDTDE
jgi:hypothetical protein